MGPIATLLLVGTVAAAAGGNAPDLWSLRPVERRSPPRIGSRAESPGIAGARPENAIDDFILARLAEEHMEPAPAADPRTLIRRACFDVTGLPPTAAEVETFVADTSPTAYARLVDRLLASPRFGERWARFWLDVARFAETDGYERDDVKAGAWRYRDWVIDALNQDMPYDRFVLEQLAGDEMPGHSAETLVATGFLRLGTWNDEPNDPAEYRYERLEDLVHVTSTAFLAVTVKCARCHDHKFDPILQTDYYRFAAHFWSGYVELPNFHGGPTKEELGMDLLGWTDRGPSSPPLHLLLKGDPRQEGPVVAPGFLSMIPALDRAVDPPPEGSRTTTRRLQLARWICDPRNPLTARVAVNRLWQHHLGAGLVRTPDNFGSKGDPPTHPELLDWLARELVDGGWSLKRLHRQILLSSTYRQASVHPREDAYALRDAENRLLWRANRRRLEAETLRDAMLVASGTLNLAAGGPSFSPVIGVEALEGLSKKENAWKASAAEARCRRSVYMFSKRSLILPLMTVFDFADTTQPCCQRDVTTVAPQALALLNNELAHELAGSMAARVAVEAGPAPDRRIETAWRIVFQRLPTPSEAEAAARHLERQEARFEAQRNPAGAGAGATGAAARPQDDPSPSTRALESLCHVLLNANELVYVD